MRIKTRILCALLAMTSLIALVGAMAVNRQEAAAVQSATTEAENVAHALGLAFLSDSGRLDPGAQETIDQLHAQWGRDLVLVDTRKRVLADADHGSVGKVFVEDQRDEVAATIRDGKARKFVEIGQEHPLGARQMVAQVQSNKGEVLGAVILEYGPLYDELLRLTRSALSDVVLVGLASAAAALIIALYLGRSIGAPIELLTRVAKEFAAGRTGLPMPPPRQDEIGDLTAAFQHMVEKRRNAEDELRRLHEELEARVVVRTAELAHANDALLAENAERQRVEGSLRETEAKFRQLADTIGDAFWIRSPDLEQVLFASPAFEKIWGRSLTDLYADAKQWTEAIVAQDRERVHAEFEALVAETARVSVEYRITQPDGSIHWIHERGFQVRDQAGKVVRLTGIATDITARKESEAEFIKVYKELLETSRQAGMAEVATGVLHNVGNVLNSVNVSTTLIIDRVKQSKSANVAKLATLLEAHSANLAGFISDHPQGRQLATFVRQLADRLGKEQTDVLAELKSLAKNIEHIKDIVAMQQTYGKRFGVRETVNVAELVEDSVRLNASALARHSIEIVRDYQPVPPITVEKHKILQILVNLVRNAKYACDEARQNGKQMTLRVNQSDGWIRIVVSDNGVGIPPENLTRIFNHGFTTRKAGHGFGLHSAALAAHQLGGALNVESEGLGRGATFTLKLPARTD